MADSSGGGWDSSMHSNMMCHGEEPISAATLERAYIAWVVRGGREDFSSVCLFYQQMRQHEITLTQDGQARGYSLQLIHVSDLPELTSGGSEARSEPRVPLYMRRPRLRVESQHSMPSLLDEISAVNQLVSNFLETTGTPMTTMLGDFEGFRDEHSIQPSLSAIAYFVELRTMQYQRDGSLANVYRGYATDSIQHQSEPNQGEVDNAPEAPNAENLRHVDDAFHHPNVLRNEHANPLVDPNPNDTQLDHQSEQDIQPPSYESIFHGPNQHFIRPQLNPNSPEHMFQDQFQYVRAPPPHYFQHQHFRHFNHPRRFPVPLQQHFIQQHRYSHPWRIAHEAMRVTGQLMMQIGSAAMLNDGQHIRPAVSRSRQFVNEEDAAMIRNAYVMYPFNSAMQPAEVVVVNNGQRLQRRNAAPSGGQIRIAQRSHSCRGRSYERRNHGHSFRGPVRSTRQGDALREALGIRNDGSADTSGETSNQSNVRSNLDDNDDLYD